MLANYNPVEGHSTCSIRTLSLSSLSLSKRSRSSFCLSISSLCRSRKRFSRSSRSRCSRSVISRRLEERGEVKWNIQQKLLHFTLQPIGTMFYTTCAFLQLDGHVPSALAFFVPSSSQMARCPHLCCQKDAACSSSSQTETGRKHKCKQ